MVYSPETFQQKCCTTYTSSPSTSNWDFLTASGQDWKLCSCVSVYIPQLFRNPAEFFCRPIVSVHVHHSSPVPILIMFGMRLKKTSSGRMWLTVASEVRVQVGRTETAIFWGQSRIYYTDPEFGGEGDIIGNIMDRGKWSILIEPAPVTFKHWRDFD